MSLGKSERERVTAAEPGDEERKRRRRKLACLQQWVEWPGGRWTVVELEVDDGSSSQATATVE